MTFLAGNYAPVSREIFVASLKVLEGTLPGDLDGFYVRNGPSPDPQGVYFLLGYICVRAY